MFDSDATGSSSIEVISLGQNRTVIKLKGGEIQYMPLGVSDPNLENSVWKLTELINLRSERANYNAARFYLIKTTIEFDTYETPPQIPN